MKKLTVYASVLTVLACSDALGPPDGAVRFDPPPEYRAYWTEMCACVGFHPSFDRVTWYMVPGDGWVVLRDDGARSAQGQWGAPHNIYLASEQLLYKALVQHEMLHDLFAPGAHGDLWFQSCDPLLSDGPPGWQP